MPATPETRAALKAGIEAAFTDPLNSQNTAAKTRRILERLVDAAQNRADDGLPDSSGVAAFATTTGSPYDNVTLAAALNRAFNALTVPLKIVRTLVDRDALEPLTICLETECIVIDPAPGAPKRYVLRYTPFTTPGRLIVWRDGAQFGPSGVKSSGQWMDAAAPFSGLRAFQEDPAGYLYHTGDYRRGYVSGASEEQAYVFQGPDGTNQPYPTSINSDANWRHIGRTDVPAATPLPPPNHRPAAAKEVRWLDSAARDAAGATDDTETLADLLALEPRNMHAGLPITVENDSQGAYQPYRVIYDGAPRPPGTGLYVFATASYEAGVTVPAKVVRAHAPEAFATPYASVDGTTYVWPLGKYASNYVGSPATLQFFLPRTAGIHPEPTEGGDATHWEPVSSQVVASSASNAIPLTGTVAGAPVTGDVHIGINTDSGLVFDGATSYKFFNDGDSLRLIDPDTGVTLASFFRTGGVTSFGLNNTSSQAVLSASATGDLLVNGQPVGRIATRPWQNGTASKAGELVTNTAGDTFRLLQDIANPGTMPALPLSSGLKPYYAFAFGSAEPLDPFDVTAAEETRVKALFMSPGQTSAPDSAYTALNAPFGTEFFDFVNGDLYKLLPNKSDVDTAGNAKPYWIRV